MNSSGGRAPPGRGRGGDRARSPACWPAAAAGAAGRRRMAATRCVTEPLDRQYLVHVLPGAPDPGYRTDPPTSGPAPAHPAGRGRGHQAAVPAGPGGAAGGGPGAAPAPRAAAAGPRARSRRWPAATSSSPPTPTCPTAPRCRHRVGHQAGLRGASTATRSSPSPATTPARAPAAQLATVADRHGGAVPDMHAVNGRRANGLRAPRRRVCRSSEISRRSGVNRSTIRALARRRPVTVHRAASTERPLDLSVRSVQRTSGLRIPARAVPRRRVHQPDETRRPPTTTGLLRPVPDDHGGVPGCDGARWSPTASGSVAQGRVHRGLLRLEALALRLPTGGSRPQAPAADRARPSGRRSSHS